ncbi:MAG: sulfite exporter TauE/SafE family protein [Acidobacteriota bacterium]
MIRTRIAVALVILLATVIRSALGFGEALVAVPLLALMLPVEVAAPVAVLVSITVALIGVVLDWTEVQARSAGRLVLATLPGIPLGLLLLKAVAEPVVKGVLGVVIILFSLYALAGKRQQRLRDDRLAWVFGFVAGILGGAYGMNGPPLAVFGALRGWRPAHFRATLQGYFLPASIIGMFGYWMAGLWTPAVNTFYLISLPAVFAGIVLGRAITRRLNAQRFVLCVNAALIAIGGILLVQAWRF